MSDVRSVVSDEDVYRLHCGDFGPAFTPRDVIDDGIRKAALGYHSGHTQFTILHRHGLVTKPRGMSVDYRLTKKGKKYARALMRDSVFGPSKNDLEYAQSLAVYAAGKLGVKEFRPLSDMYGVLTQIDNALTGLESKPTK